MQFTISKLRYIFYFTTLLVGVAIIFWINHGWQVTKYLQHKMQPAIEKHMQRVLRKHKIVVSLTTTPFRINKIRPVLETLYKQNVVIDKIYLNIPYLFKRNNIPYVIPKWMAEDQRITILRGEDYGPATKLLGTLKNAKLDPNTIIITVDDDMYYPPNLILHLAYASLKHPDSAITLFGGNIAYDATGKIKQNGMGMVLDFEPNALVETVLGYAGVAYRADFFDEQIFAISNAPQECYLHDDFYLSFHLARRSVPRRNLDSVYVSERDVICFDDIARDRDALYIITPQRAKLNIACLAYLSEQYPNTKF